MQSRQMGKIYEDGDYIIRQGQVEDCLYVIQSGKVEVIDELEGKNVRLATLSEGDFFGEMAVFERRVRSASVRALGEARVLTVDKSTFLRRMQEDPALTFRIVEHVCHRLRKLDTELSRLKADAGASDEAPIAGAESSTIMKQSQSDTATVTELRLKLGEMDARLIELQQRIQTEISSVKALAAQESNALMSRLTALESLVTNLAQDQTETSN